MQQIVVKIIKSVILAAIVGGGIYYVTKDRDLALGTAIALTVFNYGIFI